MKAMFWTKVKVCAAVLAAVAVVGTGAGAAISAAGAGEGGGGKAGTIKARDLAGREYVLDDSWKEGSRPYKKDLADREAEYRKRWGESWAGTPVTRWSRQRIMSPGVWKHEELAVIKNGKMALPGRKSPEQLGGHDHRCGIAYPLVYAPGTGETVTDIYVRTKFGFFHMDPVTKETVHVGHLPEDIIRVDPKTCPNKKIHGDPDYFVFPNPKERYPQPLKDGLDGEAHAWVTEPWCTLEPITGRVVFYQGSKWYGGKKMTGYVYRYVEKLLPYRLGGREVLLPAILDYKEMFKLVGAEPVMKDGKRAPPRFAIRTTKATGTPPVLAGGGYGRRIVLSMDGARVYVQGKGGLEGVDFATGKRQPVPVRTADIPSDRNKHGGVCGRWDDRYYNCSGQGSGPNHGVLFRVHLRSGEVERLYDSTFAPKSVRTAALGRVKFWNGPADAASLHFSSTKFQVQCPRTGAVFNSGWDGAGVPRYHDGFVTCLASESGGSSRPEWKGQFTATFGNNLLMDVAPNGDVYICDRSSSRSRWPKKKEMLKGHDRPELVDGIRIVRLRRTDWPDEQPVAGYWNRFLPRKERERLMLEHCKNYIANYARMSRIY